MSTSITRCFGTLGLIAYAMMRRIPSPMLLLALLGAPSTLGLVLLPSALPALAPKAPLAPRSAGIYAREILPLQTEEEYMQLIEDATAEERVVVIKFYASWCRACKAMAPKFQRLADDFPQIEFHEILFDNNKKLCKRLNIKILPYMEIVAGSKGKIDGFTCGPSKISMLMGKLENVSEEICDVDAIECTDISALLPE